MRIFPILASNGREAAGSLRRNRLRTLLGLVGVMIGVSSVIALVSLGEIARYEARKQFESLGTDLVVIRYNGGSDVEGIAIEDALRLADSLPSIAEAAPRITGRGTFRFGGKELGQGSVNGIARSFASVSKLPLREGRFISDLDINQYFCVIGHQIAEWMRMEGGGDPLGRLVEIDEVLFTVVGVLDHYEESYGLPVQIGANESIFIPITTARRINSNEPIDVIIAVSTPGTDHKVAADDVSTYLHSRSPGSDFGITTAKELIAQMERQMEIFALLLSAVGGISLVVGGIGVMNIMLVSVAERRVEIAIRRALGARRRDIRSQFLIESIMLTSAGGVLGTVLGLTATWAISHFTGWGFLISWFSVAGGLGTAATVGLFFGFQPAHQAARLDPIAGLQGN